MPNFETFKKYIFGNASCSKE